MGIFKKAAGHTLSLGLFAAIHTAAVQAGVPPVGSALGTTTLYSFWQSLSLSYSGEALKNLFQVTRKGWKQRNQLPALQQQLKVAMQAALKEVKASLDPAKHESNAGYFPAVEAAIQHLIEQGFDPKTESLPDEAELLAILQQPEQSLDELFQAVLKAELPNWDNATQEELTQRWATATRRHLLEQLQAPGEGETAAFRAYQQVQFAQLQEQLNEIQATLADQTANLSDPLLRELLGHLKTFQAEKADQYADVQAVILAMQADLSKVLRGIEDLKVGQERLGEQNEYTHEKLAEISNKLQAPQTKADFLTSPPADPPLAFLGREEELAEIRERLGSAQPLLLVNGLGGMGKTALALKYWQTQQQTYRLKAWVDCPNGLLQGLFDSPLEKKLGLSPDEQLDEGPRWERLWTALANQAPGPNLLVLDNVNERDEVTTYLRSLPHWQVLVTSRVSEGSDGLALLRIGELKPAKARALFARYAQLTIPDAEQDLLDRLLQAVGYHTLTTELLAKHLRKQRQRDTHYGLPQLVGELETHHVLDLPRSRKLGSDYLQKQKAQAPPISPEKILDILTAMYQMDSLDEAAREVLVHLSVLPAVFFPFAQLETMLMLDEDETADWLDQLDALVANGWLEREPEQQSLRLHPVLQEVILKIEQPSYHRLTRLVENLKSLLVQLPLGDTRVLLPSAQSLLRRLAEAHPRLGHLAWRTCDRLKELGRLRQALEMAQVMQRHFASEPASNGLGAAYNRLGDLALALGDFPLAIQHYEHMERHYAEASAANPNSESLKNGLAISYNYLGNIWKEKGNLEKAYAFYSKYRELSEELQASNPHSEKMKNDLAISYEKMGELLQAQGQFEQALDFFQKYNQLSEQLFQANPHSESLKNSLVISYSKMGDILKAQGQFEQALDFFQKYNRLREELFQANPHSESLKNGLAISYEKMGDILKAQGQFEQALDFFQKRTQLGEQLFQANPHSFELIKGLGISYSSLGQVFEEMGKAEEAREKYQEAKAVFQQLWKQTKIPQLQQWAEWCDGKLRGL